LKPRAFGPRLAAAAAVFSSSIAFSTRSRIARLPIAAPRWLAFCTALDGSFDDEGHGLCRDNRQ